MTIGSASNGRALRSLVARLAVRSAGRTEADLQADVKALLLGANFDLEDEQLDVVLEAPARDGSRQRIDVEVGATVIETKRNLFTGGSRRLELAEQQLGGYLALRERQSQRRYTGILTDGRDWRLYMLRDATPTCVDRHRVDGAKPDVDRLVAWLEAIIGTAQRISPTPNEIERRLGATSPAHSLDQATLMALWKEHQQRPDVALKRELWAKLLRTAAGEQFQDEPELFVEHTYLVLVAEAVAHCVVGFGGQMAGTPAADFVSGRLFSRSAIGGVVESDFFDWPAHVPGGAAFVENLARRAARFEWDHVRHDVLKILYESVIDAKVRKRLGEYHTPDWLAERIVREVVDDPLNQRVLDPACGSGTFLFHTVRRFVDAARKDNWTSTDILQGAVGHAIGIDVQPVAVTLARVTYLLALGTELLGTAGRPAFSVPVYLGDSVQWRSDPSDNLLNRGMVEVHTTDGSSLERSDLRFPLSAVARGDEFDRLVVDLAARASAREPGSPKSSLSGALRRYQLSDAEKEAITESYATLCDLHDAGRDHIWGYYVRNAARPAWLALPENRVDRIVGNPPWLAYRYMTTAMQRTFKARSQERGMWSGGHLATQQDLSALFVVACIEQYLKADGDFGFVMPRAVLTRRQYEGFRRGTWTTKTENTATALDMPWDLDGVEPSIFPVPCCVVMGRRVDPFGSEVRSLPAEAHAFVGSLPDRNVSLTSARKHLSTSIIESRSLVADRRSPYAKDFGNGATLYPRMLVLTERVPAPPVGLGGGQISVASRRSGLEKEPWKALQGLEGAVEDAFLIPVYLGEGIAPFRALKTEFAVLPIVDGALLEADDPRIGEFPGLEDWWSRADAVWRKHRPRAAAQATLSQWINYHGKLTRQLPPKRERVAYTKSGTNLVAVRLTRSEALIDHKLYWASFPSSTEAAFICAILNSRVINDAVRPLQSKGQFGARDFDKHVWQLPIPRYDSRDSSHKELVRLCHGAERAAEKVVVPNGTGFQAARQLVRTELLEGGLQNPIEVAVAEVCGIGTRAKKTLRRGAA